MNEPQPTETELLRALNGVVDPAIGRSLSELDMIKSAAIADGAARIEIELPTPAHPGRERLAADIESAIRAAAPGVKGVDGEFSSVVRGTDSGGAIGLRAKNVIAVGSGKGGVGKSTVAACLAFGLQTYGAKVGLMDADIYGPSIPHMLGVASQKPAAVEQQTESGQVISRLEPIVSGGVKTMSMGYIVEPEQAVVWRGPLVHRAIGQFLQQTIWGELDYLIIDLPPGTGDVSLTLSQSVGLAGAVVVCTPQQVALLDAVKAIGMFRQVNIPVLGIVENMSGEVFGRGGAQKKAAEMGVPFLGEIPMETDIRVQGDAGRIAHLFDEGNPARGPLLNICEQTALQIVRQLADRPSMPSLEIL
jgi:ATP-binding protein involved in chromosome partitioning